MSPTSATRVTIVGAGKRVVETALPAFLRARGDYQVVRVLARTARPLALEGERAPIAVGELKALRAEEIADTDLFYVAVGKGAVPEVLKKLTAFDVSRAALLIDTPVLLVKHLRHLALFDRFASASVAEDCTVLPWYDAVRALAKANGLGRVKSAVFWRSAYKYHGVAMAKALLEGGTLVKARLIRQAQGPTRRHQFGDARSCTVIEPRDYATGHVDIAFEAVDAAEGWLSDRRGNHSGRPPAVVKWNLEPLLDRGRCAGARAGEVEARLDEDEASLMRMRDESLSVTARMEDWKRVGFLRLLRALRRGEAGYPVLEGLDDAIVDQHLERIGRYARNPFTTIGTASGRAVLATLSRLWPGR